MVQMRLTARTPYALGRRLGLPMREIDEGYLAHCQMVTLFGDTAPRPFAITRSDGRMLEILGYSPDNHVALRRYAEEHADPESVASVDWPRFCSKPMPTGWPTGHRLAFWTRVCPTVRKASAGVHHRKGAEVDAFLSACWDAGDPTVPVNRETVYRQWLEDAFGRLQGASLISVRLQGFRRTRVLRRTTGDTRHAHACERPLAELAGILEVRDGQAFRRLLTRGIGRHRAFGFGMVLLRPAGV